MKFVKDGLTFTTLPGGIQVNKGDRVLLRVKDFFKDKEPTRLQAENIYELCQKLDTKYDDIDLFEEAYGET